MFDVFADTAPEPKSQQQLVDCTNGIETGNGTEMQRKNQGCKTAFADVHLLWLMDTQRPLQSDQAYPLEPDFPAGQCRNDFDQQVYNLVNSEVFSRNHFGSSL